MGLPDCRAYELVTPRDTGGASPVGVDSRLAAVLGIPPNLVASPPALASGDGFVFGIYGTTLPGTDGGGVTNAYRAERGDDGWTSRLLGPSGREARVGMIVGFSADQTFQAFRIGRLQDGDNGTFAIGPGETGYLNSPNRGFRLIGEGALPISPDEDGNPNGLADEVDSVVRWISPHGDHIAFSQGENPVRLLPEAPPEGVSAIYDRTPTGLQLVSVLSGGGAAPSDSSFEGASADGSTVLFRTGGALFARVEGLRTAEIGTGPVFGAGVSDDGRFVFFGEGTEASGNLFRYDTLSGTTATIAGSGDSQFVNVSPDGSHAYFESPSKLEGDNGVGGAPNLYVWGGGSPRFVASLAADDLGRTAIGIRVGLTQWVNSFSSSPARNGKVLAESSRVTPDGNVLVFESAAKLTGFESGGNVEIYRYDDSTRGLACVSCGRIFEPPIAGAALADYDLVAVGPNSVLGNLSEDGSTVIFQSDEALLSGDVNGATDVYEWREGNLALISTGRSAEPSLLMGASADGDDVFIRTAEQLVAGAQQDGTRAIYDARVGGGFLPPKPPTAPCLLHLCVKTPLGEPAEPEPASALRLGPPHHHVHRHKRCGRRHRGVHRTKCFRHRRHAHGGRR